MDAANLNDRSGFFDHLPHVAAFVAFAVGTLALLGWILDIAALKSVVPGLPPVKANVTVAFILIGISLWIACSDPLSRLHKIIAQGCASAVLLLGVATLSENVFQIDFGIDLLLVPDVVNYPSDIAGRMSTRVALCLVFLGTALLLLVSDSRAYAKLIQTLSLASVLIAFTGLIGYAYGIEAIYQVHLAFAPMSLNAAATIALLGLAIACARPEYLFRRLITRDSPETRRLIPVAIGLPFFSGWLAVIGYQSEYFSAPVAIALFAVVNMGGLTAVALWNASTLTRLEALRKQADNEIRKLNAELERRVSERTAELAAANEDLEGFAYSVSHDLRTPLRAIDGFSLQVQKHYADKLDDVGTRYLSIVRDNSKKMSQLIDDILAFSRMGRLNLSAMEINMDELARTIIEELKPGDAERELNIEIKPLPPCHGDFAMLRQVWVNLLGNAIKFTRHKAAARIEVNGQTEGAENIYSVKDNGAGFDMRYADKLFGVFQRLHGNEEFDGTGIGLAIVKRIVTRHGGRVWGEGKVDLGATFYFALPMLQERKI